jgi:hydrogenase maturation protein HypF
MVRHAILVRGIVQGVGFRPFVYRLASTLGLRGFVRNETGSVFIEIEGERAALERFRSELFAGAPPLARIEELTLEERPPRGETRFRIEGSGGAASPVFISPDAATCDDCLEELFDPGDRRYLYPFINCTNCGPRLTIIQGAPFDRRRTTMASFELCADCRREYEDPSDRRFHAQATACARCGPRLLPRDASGEAVRAQDPVGWFAVAIRAGKIGALKGLGGYHLVCDATSGAAVAELRRRKLRGEKPFAVMASDLRDAEAICIASSDAERELLLSPARPIVLLERRPSCPVAEEVAPRSLELGILLPYTPLHHLLLRAAGAPLVMTSGNRSDEPIAFRDEEALEKLAGIADVFLAHDRPIHVRCEDSVVRAVAGEELPVRRSRGYAPRPLPLPFECPIPILALGGQLKATFTLGRGRHAFPSHHIGDLEHVDAYRALVEDLALYEEILEVRPGHFAHDLHPDYLTTRIARERAEREGLGTVAVQHHHAHCASCMVEHALAGPVIGVVFDGTGYGTDGAVWGGEFLLAGYAGFQRAAHLRYVRMPGGDRAVREPWRMALAHLADAGAELPRLEARLSRVERGVMERMLSRGFGSVSTSSAGRLFDAAAALGGVRDRVSYEAQAAMELEWLAAGAPHAGSYPFDVAGPDPAGGPLEVDTRPLIRALVDDVRSGAGAPAIARRFHSTCVEIIASVCGAIRGRTGLSDVVLSGGVFLNALLAREADERLRKDGFRVHRHRLVPPGDGGISLGQLAVAAARLGR